MRVRRPSLLAAVLAVACLAAAPAFAQLFTWTDEKGVVHMTDRKNAVPAKHAGQIRELAQPGAPDQAPSSGSRGERVRNMIAASRENFRLGELRQIAQEYRSTHTYSTLDYFVCIDMALEMHNILKTRNFSAKVVAGTTKKDLAGMPPEKMMGTFDHAWVIVELSPGVNAAVETTAGIVVDEKVPNFEYYYQGLVFTDPRQAKDTDILIRSVNQDCAQAKELLEQWNQRYAGRATTRDGLEAKGRMESKMAECAGTKLKYLDLIKKQFARLY